MCVRGIEPRTREGDEISEKQRAWFGEEKDGGRKSDWMSLESSYSNSRRLWVLHVALACMLLAPLLIDAWVPGSLLRIYPATLGDEIRMTITAAA